MLTSTNEEKELYKSFPVGTFDQQIFAGAHPLYLTENIETSLKLLYKKGINYIISLEEKDSKEISETWENIDHKNQHITQIHGEKITFQDFSAPTVIQMSLLNSFIEDLIKRNKKIFIHCRGGLGRTGTILASVYMHIMRVPAKTAIKYVRSHYSPNAIETDEQIESLTAYENKIFSPKKTQCLSKIFRRI